jgi:hypothetical protein
MWFSVKEIVQNMPRQPRPACFRRP